MKWRGTHLISEISEKNISSEAVLKQYMLLIMRMLEKIKGVCVCVISVGVEYLLPIWRTCLRSRHMKREREGATNGILPPITSAPRTKLLQNWRASKSKREKLRNPGSHLHTRASGIERSSTEHSIHSERRECILCVRFDVPPAI